jgi:hypothetical protein
MVEEMKTFEDCLGFIENTLGCKLLDYQKIILRNTYEGKHYWYYPGRKYGLQLLLEANRILKEEMNKENDND